jgi:hypothetical protein
MNASVPSFAPPTCGLPLAKLRAALSSTHMLKALRRDWDWPARAAGALESCRVERLYPRGSKGFVVGYELRFQSGARRHCERRFGEILPGDGEAHFRDALLSLRKSRRTQLKRAEVPGRFAWLPDPGLVWRQPGLDERIDALRLLRKPGLVTGDLPPPFAAGPEASPSAELLAHRLGKRCVVRLRNVGTAGADDSVIAKMFPHRRGGDARAFATMDKLWRRGFKRDAAIHIPQPLAHLSRWSTVLMEDVCDEPVSCLCGLDPLAGALAAGRALRALHRAPIEPERKHGIEHEIGILDAWVRLVTEIYPDRGESYHGALAAIAAELRGAASFEPTPVHRDFHEKQVAVSAERTVLMDFDTLCISDPALDLGNFIAHVELAALEGRLDAAGEPVRAFREGYGARRDRRFEARVAAHRRSTLLRLACLNAFSEHRAEIVRGLFALM